MANLLRALRLFALGIAESGSDWTTAVEDDGTYDAYEYGRRFARWLRREA